MWLKHLIFFYYLEQWCHETWCDHCLVQFLDLFRLPQLLPIRIWYLDMVYRYSVKLVWIILQFRHGLLHHWCSQLYHGNPYLLFPWLYTGNLIDLLYICYRLYYQTCLLTFHLWIQYKIILLLLLLIGSAYPEDVIKWLQCQD